MKTPLAALAGAVLGGAATFAFLNSNSSSTDDDLEETRKQLTEARFDLDASRKVEGRLRDRVAELKNSADEANRQLLAGADARKDESEADPEKDKRDNGGNVFADMMRDFGKAQSDLAFNTLVEKLGLEGAELEAFKAIFEATRAKREAAFGKFATGGLTMEDFAMIEGYSPLIDDWVSSSLDASAQEDYANYKNAQETARVERKANEELTWLSAFASLNDEQKDAAYDIFHKHQTNEKPEDFIKIDSMARFEEEAAKGMNSRFEDLADVLDERQLEAYKKQSEVMMNMFKGMVGQSIGGE